VRDGKERGGGEETAWSGMKCREDRQHLAR